MENMDSQGTRGVGILATQVQGLIADAAAERAESKAWRDAHESQHAQHERDRVIGRRWLIGTCIALVGLLTAVLTFSADILARLH